MKKLNAQQRNVIQKWALYGLLLFIGFTAADLGIIYVREYFIPQSAPPKKAPKQQASGYVDRSQYSAITNRNLFSSSGTIPDALAQVNAVQDGQKHEDVPVQSNLPLVLVGTLVHTDPSKSVAAIEVKSKNMSGSYMVGAEIENMAKVEKVERGIVYFRNLNNGALEYIELNRGNSKVSFDSQKAAAGPVKAGGKEIQSVGNNTFRVKRADLNKYLNDLSGLLMQARALPNRDKDTGEINGYRLVDYQPGSIFEQMGLPRGTLIKSAGGEPVNSIQSAMEMFNKLKKESKVKLGVEVNGSDTEYNYEIQ
ncbi:general secretion pathway protein GspC [Bdellovibrio sp. qaytius]|nr:general secretion pathway protein GspC [Bdellovibrio sp. qaytius]